MEEKNLQHDNASARINPTNDVDKDQPPARDLSIKENGMRMKKFTNKRIGTTDVHIATNEYQSGLLNTAAYNKILIEVYQIVFFILAITIVLTRAVVRTNLKIDELGEHSRLILCFLDLAPRFLVSILLPLTIHACNPEIKIYVKGFFC